jgi:hypothetical protein
MLRGYLVYLMAVDKTDTFCLGFMQRRDFTVQEQSIRVRPIAFDVDRPVPSLVEIRSADSEMKRTGGHT